MNTRPFEFVTDTSSLCVYDLDALKHRLNDDVDWWCWPPERQVDELNAGNVAFLDVGRDGKHQGVVLFAPLEHPQYQVVLSCPSGRVFVGAAEEATSDGMEPDCTRGGLFVQVPEGTVRLQLSRTAEGLIQVAIEPQAGPARNSITQALRLA